MLLKYQLKELVKRLPLVYLALPVGLLLALLLILFVFVFPLYLRLVDTVNQHQQLSLNKQALTKNLHLTKEQLFRLKDIDQRFNNLIAKYRSGWQNVSWLSRIQGLIAETPEMELQEIKLAEKKEIQIAANSVHVQLISIELEAGYTAFIHWLVVLAEQPALLSIERLLLTQSPDAEHRVSVSMSLAIYYPETSA